jgi:ABC-type glycerol-3-phosphate transport system substrate-binding protein
LTRRDFLRFSAVAATGAAMAACAPAAAPQIVEVTKEVVVEKETIKEVPKEVVVEKEKVVEKVVTPTPLPAAPGAKPVIRWQYDGSGRWMEAATKSAEKFNELYDDIELLIEPRPPEVFEKLIAAMVAGVAPEIFEYWGLWFAKFNQKGQLQDLQPLCDQSYTAEDLKDFVKNEWENFSRLSFIPGIRVAMPRYINWMWLHYNKTMMQAEGVELPTKDWTVDDMAAASLKMTKKAADGTVERFGNNFPSWSMERMFYHLNRFGGSFVKYEDPAKCLLGTQQSQEALEWMRARYWDDHSWAEPLLTNRSWGGDIFFNGYTAMNEDGGPYSSWGDAIKDTFEWDFTHPPIGPVARTTYQVTDGYGMWKNTKFPDAAWEVMMYLAGPINQEIRMRTCLQEPVRYSTLKMYKEAVASLVPSMAKMSLDTVAEAFEMGYGHDDERYLCQAEAEEVINPLLEKVYVVGDTPVSVLADGCPQVEAAQTCEKL